MRPEGLDDVMRRALGHDRNSVVREYRKLALLAQSSPPVLDLGCGSGTLLETLEALAVPAEGVDGSSTAVAECQRRGLKTTQADLLAFLSGAGAETWGTVFAAHVIEHLPPPQARELWRHAWRVLRPGGLLILLTPNPRNLYVAGEGFWTDPTHVRPYPATLLKALALDAGFSSLTVRGWWGGLTPKQLVLGVARWLVTGGLHQPFTGLLAVAQK